MVEVAPLPNVTAAFANKLVNMENLDYAQGGNYSTHFTWQPGTQRQLASGMDTFLGIAR